MSNDLNAARGIITGLLISLPIWFLIASILIVWAA